MAGTGPSWFAIIDGSRDPRLEGLVRGCREHACLFKGKIDPRIAQVAPWLVRVDQRDPLLSIWQAHGRGQAWGLMACSDRTFEQLHRHFRRFLQAMLPDGMVVTFRFYDPRVFNTYICAALPDERAPWFDGVSAYAAESPDGSFLHQYRLAEGKFYDGDRIIG